MKKLISATAAAIVIGGILFLIFSKDGREEALARAENAARAIGGESGAERTPDIVKQQQRKERIRQNTKWTAENQALHPLEYCQAQLEELDKHASQLDVAAHKVAVSQSTTKRQIAEAEATVASTEKFLEQAKAAYRVADSNNKWPMSLNGFTLTKEKAQEKIVEAANRIPALRQTITTRKNTLALLEKKSETIVHGRKQLVTIRERIQGTINDLNTKKVLDGEKGIMDALNSINDSMGALCGDTSEPSIDDLTTPSAAASREATFKEIMAK